MNKQKSFYFLCLFFSLYITALYAQEPTNDLTIKGYAFPAESEFVVQLLRE